MNLLTAHGKGSEFEYVFFAGCNAAVIGKKKRKPYGGYVLPDTIFSLKTTSNKDDEELRRLFYVALTRAQQHLQILFPVLMMMAKNLNRVCLLLK